MRYNRAMRYQNDDEPRNRAPAGWFQAHRTNAIVGLVLVIAAFVSGMIMWLADRLPGRDPNPVLAVIHGLLAILGLFALTITTVIGLRRPGRLSLERITTRRQQWVLQHRWLAFTTLFLGVVMLITGVWLLVALFIGRGQSVAFVYGHLLTGVMLLGSAAAAFWVGWYPVRRNRGRK